MIPKTDVPVHEVIHGETSHRPACLATQPRLEPRIAGHEKAALALGELGPLRTLENVQI